MGSFIQELLTGWAVNFHTWLSIITISGNKQNENMPKVIKRCIIVYIQSYSLQFGLIAFNVPFHCEKHCNLLQILLGKPSVTYKFYLARNKDIWSFFNDSFIP